MKEREREYLARVQRGVGEGRVIYRHSSGAAGLFDLARHVAIFSRQPTYRCCMRVKCLQSAMLYLVHGINGNENLLARLMHDQQRRCISVPSDYWPYHIRMWLLQWPCILLSFLPRTSDP